MLASPLLFIVLAALLCAACVGVFVVRLTSQDAASRDDSDGADASTSGAGPSRVAPGAQRSVRWRQNAAATQDDDVAAPLLGSAGEPSSQGGHDVSKENGEQQQERAGGSVAGEGQQAAGGEAAPDSYRVNTDD